MTRKDKLFMVFIYLFSVFLRSYQLSETTVYPDEATWMVRGKETIYALKNLNFSYFKTAWYTNDHDTQAIGLPLVLANGISHVLFAGTGKYSLKILTDINASRLPLILISSLTPVFIFKFTQKFSSRNLAILSSLTYSISPIVIGVARWVINDSLLTLFIFLSVTGFITSAAGKKLSWSPGIWLALSFLTKPNGLLPIVSWICLVILDRSRLTTKLFLINLFCFFITTLLIWPASWSHPFSAIPEYLARETTLSGSGDPIPNFYNGKPTFHPESSYYLYAFISRLPEVIIVFSLISICIYVGIFRKNIANHSVDKLVISCLVFFLSFLIVISVSPKKGGIRYALPLVPWIYILSAWGFRKALQHSRNITNSLFFQRIASGAFILLAYYPLIYHPNYYLYYNHFVGGPANVQKTKLVGLCFGNKRSLEYLDENHIEGVVAVIGCADAAPYHTTRALTKDWEKADLVILESSFQQQFPDSPAVLSVRFRNLIHTVIENGVVTAKIYQ